MKKEPLFIAFSTQKGGAGKTTLTVLMASYLYYVKGYDVAVVDCDYPQFSLKDMRERDLKNIERNPHLRRAAYEQFKRLGKRAYPIVGSRPDHAVEAARPFVESETPPDFVFFDLTGTVNNMGLIKTVATMDYIFCPIAADRFIMESSLKYAGILNDTLVTTGKSNIKGIRLLWKIGRGSLASSHAGTRLPIAAFIQGSGRSPSARSRPLRRLAATKNRRHHSGASCKKSFSYDFLRRHYPHQVKGSKLAILPLSPLHELPCV